jgi:quercetin dioxygenase-like cupin family protein
MIDPVNNHREEATAMNQINTTTAPSLDNIARDLLETAPGLEVVTSVVELPANFRLPAHTHPGEEFAYVIEGSVHLWEQGRDEVELTAGDYGKVSVGTVHTVRTGDEPAKLIVFRVHPVGAPERIPVDVAD